MAVGILDSELAESMRRVVDRVVDGRPALLHLRVHGIGIVDADIDVPRLVDDAPVRDDALRFATEGKQNRRAVPLRAREGRRIAEHLARESELFAVVPDRSFDVSDEEDRRDSRYA